MGANTGASHGPPAELEPIGRFQWEQSLRMLALPWPTKSVAFLLATYADKNGTNIHPGEDHLARVTGLTVRSVRSHLAALRETYYLIERTDRGSTGGRRAVADDYRLVMPDDVMVRIGLVADEQLKRPTESPAGLQDRLPIEAVDNPQNTGNELPVDNQDHRKLTSGDNPGTPETDCTITGNLLHDHRKSSVGTPEADFRSPLREPIHDQNPDHLSSPDLPNHRAAAAAVDNVPVDNPPYSWASVPPAERRRRAPGGAPASEQPRRPGPPPTGLGAAGWGAAIATAREAMAQARHARPTPPPIVRPDDG